MKIKTIKSFNVILSEFSNSTHELTEIWSGSTFDLARDNEYDHEVMIAISALRKGMEETFFGGGAAPTFHLAKNVEVE